MFNLHILDVSALLHYGMNSSRYKDKTSCTYNVGGIHKVMRQVAIAIANNDDVILAFDSKKNFRKTLMPEYKVGRVPNKFVLSQAELLWERLPQCGIACYKLDGYEGDDIINWCTDLREDYANVLIHGNDKDLIHNVRDNVSFHSITDTVNNVTPANFPFAIEKGEEVPFNFVSVIKALKGCTSDKIPAMKFSAGYNANDVFQWYRAALNAKEIPFVYENTANRELFLKVMQYLPGITQEELQELERRVKLVFPAIRPEDFDIVASKGRLIDKNQLTLFLALVNDFDTLKALKLYRPDLSEEDRKFLRDRQQRLISGEYAVDRNMVVNDSFDDSLLTLKEF